MMKLSILGLLFTAGFGIILWQRQTHETLQGELAVLTKQNQRLVLPPASSATEKRAAPASVGADPVQARAEVATLQKAVETAINRDPEKGLVPVGQLHNVGRATPAAAFQTVIWAAMSGADDELAASMAVSPAARRKWDESMLSEMANLPAAASSPEKYAGLFFSKELLQKIVSVEFVGATNSDDQHVILNVRATNFAEQTRVERFPMELRPTGWLIMVPDDMLDSIAKAPVRPTPTPSRP